MSNQYYNFYYDPIHLGYGPSSWRTLYGDITVGGGKLRLSNAAILHYADILRADASFSVNLPAPAIGADRKFGFLQYNKNAYAYFKILNNVLTVETSDGTTQYSTAITWLSTWTNTDTIFRIKWETGLVTFYIGSTQQAVVSYSTLLDVPVSAVPNDAMNLYVSDDSGDTLLLNYIDVKSIQSYIMNDGDATSEGAPLVFESDKITITENLVIDMPINISSISDSISISESITKTLSVDINLSDELTLTEAVTLPDILDPINVSGQLNITEDVAVFMLNYIAGNGIIYDNLNITEDIVMEKYTG